MHLFVPDTFTVAQAVNALGFGWFQVKLSLFVGLCWMSDSMEMTILSVIGPALHCDWGISRYQQAMVTTVVFLGMMLSSTFWGSLSDKYGRKPVIVFLNLLKFVRGMESFLILGVDTLRNPTIPLRPSQCSCTKFRLAIAATRTCRLCNRCRTSKCHPLC